MSPSSGFNRDASSYDKLATHAVDWGWDIPMASESGNESAVRVRMSNSSSLTRKVPSVAPDTGKSYTVDVIDIAAAAAEYDVASDRIFRRHTLSKSSSSSGRALGFQGTSFVVEVVTGDSIRCFQSLYKSRLRSHLFPTSCPSVYSYQSLNRQRWLHCVVANVATRTIILLFRILKTIYLTHTRTQRVLE